MPSLSEFNPLKSIAVPNIGVLEPKGLVLVIGPNSAGKTQFLRDIHSSLHGQARKLVVCDDVELTRPPSFDELLDVLIAENHVRRRVDDNNNFFIDSVIPHFGAQQPQQQNWSLIDSTVRSYFDRPFGKRIKGTDVDGCTDKFLEHFGRSFVAALFLDRRLTATNTVDNFDYQTSFPSNELQALYFDDDALRLLTEETSKVFGKAVWVDPTRANRLCIRVANGPQLPPAEDRLQPRKVKEYRLIEDEGDGFRSYVAICMTILVGRRPIVLVDEPEMCLHPPQAHALGRFIGKYGVSSDRMTFVATHSSHLLRGIIEEAEELEVLRLSRVGLNFTGRRVSKELLRASIEKPSTKSESILDGLFAESVTVVESEGDRLVYGTTWDKVASEFSHDVHFVSVGGLGGIAEPLRLYRTLKIPVCVAVDLDVIRELGTFESILRAAAPAEEAAGLIAECRKIVSEVKSLGPIYDELYTRDKLTEMLAEEFDWKSLDRLKAIRGSLSDLSAGLSETSRLKNGLDALQGFPVYHNLRAFLNQCRTIGVYLVPVGELEDWVPHLTTGGPSKRKKAEWANFAAGRIRESPHEANDVWEFVRTMGEFQRNEGARLAGFPSSRTQIIAVQPGG